jgi:macrolide transport system ATP-binding/permease protein
MSNVSSLRAQNLVKSYGDRRVLDRVSLDAAPGRRIGLVGENGAGKSTLLRLLAGVEEPDDGVVERPADCGFLWQELPFAPAATVRDVLDDALSDVRTVQARLDELATRLDDAEAVREYGELLDWAHDHDLWDADRRAELVLAGLGLSTVEAEIGSLSGGQRARLGLAALLVRRPSALLLDEPTNHLDDEAVAFLERQLVALPGVVVIASHDRVFLDEVCTDVVDLDPARGGVTRYGGAYTAYLRAKRLERVRWEQQYQQEQDELIQLRNAVDVTARAVNHHRPMKDGNKVGYDRHGGRVQKQISRRVRNA